jgi:hypothetical protein
VLRAEETGRRAGTGHSQPARLRISAVTADIGGGHAARRGTTLAILKARLEGWPKASPWYPALLRYIELIAGRLLAGRLRGIGGDPEGIPPFLGCYGPGRTVREPEEQRLAFTGKVVSLIYDRFGDFCGFVLDTEDGARRFAAGEPEIERVVNRAWAERIVTSVFVERHASHRPEEIVLHSASESG